MIKVVKYLAMVTLVAFIGVNSIKMNNIAKPDVSLRTLMALSMANAENDNEYIDRFLMNVSTTLEAHVEVDTSGIITKALGVAFTGSIKVTKTVTYDCCKTGGGSCSKDNPKCEDVNAFGLIVGMFL